MAANGVKKGAAALGALTASNEGGSTKEITSFKSGTTLKVRVKGTDDLAHYFNYGLFRKVNSFVPEEPSERNERGFVTANPTPWDQAAQYYFDLAKKAGNKDEEERLKAEGRKYKGKEKFLMGFYDLSQGKDIVVDLTKAQAQAVYQTILEYEDELSDLAFKLSKQGESTSTTVSLTPIINIKKGLTDDEQKNFEESAWASFNQELFDGVLFEYDEAKQIEALGTAGFDVSLIGLTAAASNDEVTPIEDGEDDPTGQF